VKSPHDTSGDGRLAAASTHDDPLADFGSEVDPRAASVSGPEAGDLEAFLSEAAPESRVSQPLPPALAPEVRRAAPSVSSAPASPAVRSGWARWQIGVVAAAGVAIIGAVAVEYGWRQQRASDLPDSGSAATSVAPVTPPAPSPPVEVRPRDTAPETTAASKDVKKDAASTDVRSGPQGRVGGARSDAPVSVPRTAKLPPKTRSLEPAPSHIASVVPSANPADAVPIESTLRVSPVPALPAITPPVAEFNNREAIQRVLTAYEDSYDRLDAPAAALLWRGVDTRALQRAFGALDSQDLSFEKCDLTIDGAQATAVCRGQLRYVRRVGTPTPHVLRGSWKIDFQRANDRWVISNVKVH
jgi:hypothetical protein